MAATSKRVVKSATALCLAMSVVGCAGSNQGAKNLGDYLNLRNSFLDPSQVGRFDKSTPWGTPKPVTWPILDQLDVVDEPNDTWTTATDPLPSDVVTDMKEYTVGEGDIARVSVFELVTPGMEYQKEVQINEVGEINLYSIGRVLVAGLTPTQIEEKIGQIAVEKGLLRARGDGNPGPQVSFTLLSSRARVFSVLGQVGQAGTYSILSSDFRLLDALAMSRDILGGTQPGMDYLYVIRTPKGAGVIPAARPATSPGGALDAIDSIERQGTPGTSTPTPSTTPTPVPGTPFPPTTPTTPVIPGVGNQSSEGPQFVRPLPTAVVFPSNQQLAQGDLDAALGGIRPTPTTPPPTPAGAAPTPAAPGATPAPAMMEPATTPPQTATPGATGQGEDLLNQAVGGTTTRPGQYIFVDGKWVLVNGPQPGTGMTPEESLAAATGLSTPRVIRIPIDKLKEGDPRYNIVIRPGDVIHVPNIVPGEFYMYGHVGRPGVYSLTGRKVTLKQALAAAGGLDSVAIPRKCDLVRRIGPNQEVTVMVDLTRIFDGEQPDIFLKPNDFINVGTDAVAPFLAVTRNAYRASYGWGFVYDRNYYIQPTINQIAE